MRECASPGCSNRTSDPNHPSHLCAICRQRREAQFAAEDALGDAFDQRRDARRCSGCGVPEGYLHSKDCPLPPAFDDPDAPGEGERLGGLHYPPGAEELTLGRKEDALKPRLDLLVEGMPRALEEVAMVLTFGSQKYADHNWQRVARAPQRYLAAGMRHELALAAGETHDPETGAHHLAHKLCCDLFRLELALRGEEATCR